MADAPVRMDNSCVVKPKKLVKTRRARIRLSIASDLVQRYRDALPAYQSFASRLENLIAALLKAEGVRVHFTEARAKTPESFKEKISRPGSSYDDPLNQIPDLVGVRIVLYYQDDVERVGELIKREFEVLEVERSHQIDKYSPDQFGYLSVHHIVRLSVARSGLMEWKSAAGLRAEVQVRTVLQHSWAAISHALQYKREGDVPISLRRKLFRLAGLFELADEEFMELRDARARLAEESREVVRRNDDMTPLDAPIVRELISSSPRFNEITHAMRRMGYEFRTTLKDFLGAVVEECERLGLATIGDLNKLLAKDFGAYLASLAPRGWEVSNEFALLLLLIGAHPAQFSPDYLVSRGWHPQIAERVTAGAIQNGPAKQ